MPKSIFKSFDIALIALIGIIAAFIIGFAFTVILVIASL